MVTWMVNVTLWVMRFVHSRSKSHTNLIPTVFLPPLSVPLLQLYNRVVRIKVKAVRLCCDCLTCLLRCRRGGLRCALLNPLFWDTQRSDLADNAKKQSSVVHWIICLWCVLPVLPFKMFTFMGFSLRACLHCQFFSVLRMKSIRSWRQICGWDM